MSLLQALVASGALRTLDHAFARTLARLDPATPDAVLAAAALASLAVANGHAGFDPCNPHRLLDGELPWPAPAAWQQALLESRWVARPGAGDAESAEDAPLVFEGAPGQPGLLYLRRYREYERRLALGLRRIAAHAADTTHADALAALFAALFPEAKTGDDLQARAAALALRHRLVLVTGGPGTGKTTTTARLLVLRVAQALAEGRVAPRIGLAAPTGRAAERMAESVRKTVQSLALQGIDAQLLQALPSAGTTLHRLLGTIPDSPRFRHHADNPLAFDIVVVDEASMVDLPLMCKLTEAVAEGAQLILLGDPDQLPSVEAGDVLAAILGAAGEGDALAETDARALQPLLGAVPIDADVSGLRGHRVHLRRGWRQDEALQLSPLAEAVRVGDAHQALRLLRGGELGNVHFHEGVDDPLLARPDLLGHWRALATLDDPTEALRQASRLRLLTALREGPQGARGLNARIEAQLSGQRIGTRPTWFAGRLLLVTENSYRHGLFNGDVGLCLADADGTPLSWFPGGSEGVRAFHPSALPAHESAFAMTVHKAQGSEFDEVWLQLPRSDSRVLSRELLYTGLTRARTILHVAGSETVIRDALSRHASRVSGLGWRLG